MTGFTHSTVVIVKATIWPAVRIWFEGWGYEIGEGVYLSSSGDLNTTHRGMHAWLDDAGRANCDSQNTIPWIYNALDDVTANGFARFNSICLDNGLQTISIPFHKSISATGLNSDAGNRVMWEGGARVAWYEEFVP